MTPAIGLKRLAFGVVAITVAAFAALAAIPFLIKADTVRESVKSEIRYATGIDPVLHGDVSVSLFPFGSASFDDVVLSDDDEGTPALATERLTAQLRLWPLLLGRIEVGEVTLVRPRIVVELDDAGRSNWARLITRLIEAAKPATRAKYNVSFSEIRLVDGTVRISDRNGRVETFDRVGLSLAWPSISKSFAATGHFAWNGEMLDASFTLSDFLAALMGDRSGLKARLSGGPLKLAFDGHMGARPTLKVEGTLAADGPSLRNVLEWTGVAPLPGGGFGRFALKAQANMVGQSVAFSGVNMELDGNAAEGVLSLTLGERPQLQGTLAAEQIDITPYVGSVQMLGAGNEREWSRLPIKLDGLKGLEFDLRLSAARVMLAGSRIGRTALTANLRDGRFALNIGESRAFDGVVKGTIGIAGADTGADMKAQLQFTGVDLEKCFDLIFGMRKMEGRGDFALNLDASGSDVYEITRSLNGTGTLVAKNGALVGVNVEQLLRRLERRPLSGGGDFRNGRTPFENLTVLVKIVNGTANVEDVKLEGSSVRLALDGSASIPARNLDLKGTATLIGANVQDTGDFALPFVVRGRWDDPLMLPDADILIRRSGAAGPLWEAVRGGRARDAVRSAIDQLTRGSDSALAPAADR